MSLISWNCPGLGNPLTTKVLKKMVLREKPLIVFLMETKLSSEDMEKMQRSLGFKNGCHSATEGRSGGLGLWWMDQSKIRVLRVSKHIINTELEIDGEGLHFTVVYGYPRREIRREVWEEIQSLDKRDSVPWLLIGDFNTVLSSEEKKGGNVCSPYLKS